MLVVVAAVTAAATTPVLAAKGGKPGVGITAAQACSVTPGVVAVGGVYTVRGSGFQPGAYLNVMVKDPVGTLVFAPAVDSGGEFSVSSYASWSGASAVSVIEIGGPKAALLASCSFQVS
jgi:hypothetical protein